MASDDTAAGDGGGDKGNDGKREGEERLPEGSRITATWSGPDGASVDYSADARWMALRDDKDRPLADLFSVSYVADPPDPSRPVTFVFNGGPGASSAYLHVGALGPRRVSFSDSGMPLPPPTTLNDNAESWLAFTDLVFVDPVGTGWSRVIDRSAGADGKDGKGGAGGTADGDQPPDPKAFFGLQKDLDSLTELISRWLSAHGRWSSPLFVAGESYGGFRAAKLARLCNERGMGLNGTILISPALEFALLDPSDYDVLSWVDLVPTMALAAHHHGRSRTFDASTSPDEVRAAAEQLATGPLAVALIRGATLPADEKQAVVQQLADLLGLDADLVDRHELRIPIHRFARELLREQGLIVGLYDATATGRDPFPDREGMEWPDPTLSGIDRVFTAGINALLRGEIGVETEREYHLLSMQVNKDWKIDVDRHALQSQMGATDDLRYGMALNPHMKVFLTHGLFDMVTPFFASERLRNLLRLDETAAAALTTRYFSGGHMFYAWEESRVGFRDAIAEFYDGALPG